MPLTYKHSPGNLGEYGNHTRKSDEKQNTKIGREKHDIVSEWREKSRRPRDTKHTKTKSLSESNRQSYPCISCATMGDEQFYRIADLFVLAQTAASADNTLYSTSFLLIFFLTDAYMTL